MPNDFPKIALFTDTYDEVNGVANTFRYLTEYCCKHNRQLDIYAHSDKADRLERCGSVTIRRYQPAVPLDIYFDMIFDLKLPRLRIFNDARARKYDLIHIATPGSLGLNGWALARLDHIPLIGSYHTSLPEYLSRRVDKIARKFKLPPEPAARKSEDLMWDYVEWFYNQTKLVLAPSRHTQSVLQARFNTKIGIFSRGIDTERFHPRHRQEPDKVTVLYVGRVSTEKNLDVLADIFRDRDDARLLIVGDGPYKTRMQRDCPRAIFTGFLQGQPLSCAYASADIFVFPSTTDTFGNVVLEAMSSGLPVIVTDKMGPQELVTDGTNGFITCDPADFRRRLDLLIQDRQLRRQMAAHARRTATLRSWDAVFDRLFLDYRAVADQT